MLQTKTKTKVGDEDEDENKREDANTNEDTNEDEDVLEAKLASKDSDTNVIKVSVTTDDAELSGKSLEAIVRGYQEYVSEKLESSSTDAINALRKYNDQYERDKDESIRDTELLKRNNDLLCVEGKPQDPLATKQTAGKKRRQLRGHALNPMFVGSELTAHATSGFLFCL